MEHKMRIYVQPLILLYVYLSINTHKNVCVSNDILVRI